MKKNEITDPTGQPPEKSLRQIFESENIRFVEVSELLIPDYLVMINDIENVDRFIGGSHEPYTREQEIQWVREKLEEKAQVFSMIEKKTGRFIGNVELMDVSRDEGELGIAITAEKQNQGFGTEAVRALTQYGISHLGLQRILLRTRPFNTRAIRVYEKCGFIEYGRDEDHIYMEYRPARGSQTG